MTIEEQKKILSERLRMEALCSSEDNLHIIESFQQAEYGDRIARYLKNEAWKDDKERNTKVFLVRDIVSNEIAYYFAINCGIIYSDIEEIKLAVHEKDAYDRYVKAVLGMKKRGLSSQEQEAAEIEYKEAMEELAAAVGDSERASYLFSCAEEKVLRKEDDKDEKEHFRGTDEKTYTVNVKETFPAIDIKFLCRNKNYNPGIPLDIKIGVYVFWEIIVPHLMRVSNCVGCKYIYLFAADNSETVDQDITMPVMFTPDYDPYDDDVEEAPSQRVRKLVEYYINELKFKWVTTNYKILKPDFERKCYTLIQEVDDLLDNREIVWQSHSTEEDS